MFNHIKGWRVSREKTDFELAVWSLTFSFLLVCTTVMFGHSHMNYICFTKEP